jgi:hypothetical protein
VDYSTGYMYYAGGRAGKAAGLLAQSLLTYPAPMSPPDVRYHWARVRLLLRAVLAGGRERFLSRRNGLGYERSVASIQGIQQ